MLWEDFFSQGIDTEITALVEVCGLSFFFSWTWNNQFIFTVCLILRNKYIYNNSNSTTWIWQYRTYWWNVEVRLNELSVHISDILINVKYEFQNEGASFPL